MTDVWVHIKVCDYCGDVMLKTVNDKRSDERKTDTRKYRSGTIDVPVGRIKSGEYDFCPTCQDELKDLDKLGDQEVAIRKMEAFLARGLPDNIRGKSIEGIHEIDESEGST